MATPVTRPFASTVAMFSLLDPQVTVRPGEHIAIRVFESCRELLRVADGHDARGRRDFHRGDGNRRDRDRSRAVDALAGVR